jgi:branched-chain amino acid transport system substrate-binding protein
MAGSELERGCHQPHPEAGATGPATPGAAGRRVDFGRRALLKGAALGGAASLLAPGSLLAEVNDGRPADGPPIPVGSALGLTDWGSHDGVEFRNGLTLALEEINALGGVLGRPLRLYVEDTKAQGAKQVVAAFTKLIEQERVHAIINGYNIGPNNAEYEVVADAGIPYLHHNGLLLHHDTVMSNQARYFGCFQCGPAEYWYGVGFIQFISWLRDSGQWRPRNNRIALISGSAPYSVVIMNAMHETAPNYGWEVAYGPEIVKTPTSEWGPVLANVRAADPSVFANTHFPPEEIAQCQNQFMQDPIDALTYYQVGAISPLFTATAKENALGTLVSTLVGLLQDDGGVAFEKRYHEQFGPDAAALVGCQTYVALWHWAMAASLAGGSGEPGNFEQNRKVAYWLRNFVYRSVVGAVNMHPQWQAAIPYPDVTKDPSLGMPHLFYQVQEVSPMRTLIGPPPYQTGTFRLPAWFQDNGGLPQLGKA